jgi:hypothetical protein
VPVFGQHTDEPQGWLAGVPPHPHQACHCVVRAGRNEVAGRVERRCLGELVVEPGSASQPPIGSRREAAQPGVEIEQSVGVDGEVAGTWRRSKERVTITPWRRLSPEIRDSIEAGAAALPLTGIGTIAVDWGV